MIEPFLQLVADTLEAGCDVQVDAAEAGERQSRRERRRLRRRADPADAPMGKWWSKEVPGTKPWIPFVLAYCRERQARIDFCGLPLWTGDVNGIVPRSDGLVVQYSQSVAGGSQVLGKSRLVQYPGGPSGKFSQLVQGNPTRFGRMIVTVSPAQLLYTTGTEGDMATLSWQDMRFEYDGIGPFDFAARLERIEIGEETGEVVLSGWKNALTPILRWAD